MFIRVKTKPNTNKKAVQIVQSKRQGKKVNQKVLHTVGYAFDDETISHLKDVAEHMKARLLEGKQPSLFGSKKTAEMAIKARKKKEETKKDEKLNVDLKKVEEIDRHIIGISEVYGQVYEELGFGKLLSTRYSAAANMLFHLVMGRLTNPQSKRATVSFLEKDFGIALNLNNVYKAMDKIDDKIIDRIQNQAYKSTQSILQKKINILFYDCTTLYFESFTPDSLKKNGYSKDGKFNQPQVLLALLITEESLPVGYQVFPGNTFEGHTLAPVLEKIKSKYDLGKVIFVADSGLLSKENRNFLEKNNFNYILGARLKNLPKKIQDEIINSFQDDKKTEKTAEINYEGKRLLIKYNPKRAKKDKKDREEAIEKVQKKLAKSKDPKSLLSNYGYKKFLNVTGTSTLKINQDKLSTEEAWDGISGIITNNEEISHKEAFTQYKNLWQIENCFRIQKTDLKIRPIYHWTPRRVQTHIAMCFMAFCCQQYLSYRLKMQKINLSIEKIRDALVRVQVSIIKHKETKTYYGIPSKGCDDAKSIYKILRLKYDTVPYLIRK